MATVPFESTPMKFTRVAVNPNQMGGRRPDRTGSHD